MVPRMAFRRPSSRSVQGVGTFVGVVCGVTALAAGPLQAQFGRGRGIGSGFNPGGGGNNFRGSGSGIGSGSGSGIGSGSGQGGGFTGSGSGSGFNPGGSGFGPGGSGSGFGRGSGGSGFGPGRGGSGLGFGVDGGAIGSGRRGGGIGGMGGGSRGSERGGGEFTLNPGQRMDVEAACTDLFLPPPTEATQYAGGAASNVLLADGSSMGLDQALKDGILVLTGSGTSRNLNPLQRTGNPLLKLTLRNVSQVKCAVQLVPGTHVTPLDRGAQRLPESTERLFSVAAERKTAEGTLQHAVWAARGSTLEDVEQTQMTRVSAKEAERVQALLDEAGVKQRFDRQRGEYERRYEDALDKLGDKAKEIQGTAYLGDGSKAQVEGARLAEGEGVLTVKSAKRDGEFRYRAEFTPKKDGRISVKLFHLVTGQPLVAQPSLLVYPSS